MSRVYQVVETIGADEHVYADFESRLRAQKYASKAEGVYVRSGKSVPQLWVDPEEY